MKTTILVAGATGNLGGRIVRSLLEQGAEVRALVRRGTSSEKRSKLESLPVKIAEADMASSADLAKACEGAACVVSALQGLRDVIVDGQSRLLDAAIAAGVPRFIPSDFSMDWRRLPEGQNRNLDLRRAFHQRLDAAPIAATSILNGAFGELLVSVPMFIDFSARRVGYWENPDQRMDFTTMDNIAAFTAAAALDASTPTVLQIAGDQKSPRDLAGLASEVIGASFDLARLGSLTDLDALIQKQRAADPESERTLFPRWQGLQYVLGMASGLGKLDPLDNARYPNIHWTSARELIESAINRNTHRS